MNWSFYTLILGFCIDLLLGDPHGFPHPVVLIGKLIDALGRLFRALLPKTKSGEIAAGALLWVFTAAVSTAIPALLLIFAQKISVWLRLALESIMCWQILATKSLRDESMKVYAALQNGSLSDAQRAVSMIVGRDTNRLDEKGVARAAVETVAEMSLEEEKNDAAGISDISVSAGSEDLAGNAESLDVFVIDAAFGDHGVNGIRRRIPPIERLLLCPAVFFLIQRVFYRFARDYIAVFVKKHGFCAAGAKIYT